MFISELLVSIYLLIFIAANVRRFLLHNGISVFNPDNLKDENIPQLKSIGGYSQDSRFTTEDPIRDGLNWYAYCGNDPVNKVDPLGLCTESDSQLVDQLGTYGSPYTQQTIENSSTNLYTLTQTAPYDPTGGGQFLAESLRPEYGALNTLGTGSGFAGTSRITTYRPYGSDTPSNWELETIKPRTDDSGFQPSTGEPLYEWQWEGNEEVARSFSEANPELIKQALERTKPSTGQKILEFITTILVPRN